MTGEFIRDAYRNYKNINAIDALFSSPIFLILKFCLVFFFTLVFVLVISVLAGLRGGGFLFLFFLVLITLGFFSIRSYQRFHRKSPVRRKMFAYRIAQLLEYLASRIDHIEGMKNHVRMRMAGSQGHVKVRYDINLLLNAGGFMGGRPLAVPKAIHPDTFFFILEGRCRLFENERANFNFTKRRGDTVAAGSSIGQYRLKKGLFFINEHLRVTSTSPAAEKFMGMLEEAVEKTGLSGEIEFNRGRFQLKLFDTIRSFGAGSGKIVYRHYHLSGEMEHKSIQESQMAFYGIEDLLQLVASA
jgi:hypothetical protein